MTLGGVGGGGAWEGEGGGAAAGFGIDLEKAGGVFADEFEAVDHFTDGGFFFDLFLKEPGEEVEGGEIAFLLGEGVEVVDLAGDALFLGQGGLEDIDGILAEVGGWGFEGLEGDGGVACVEVVEQFHSVGILFGGLKAEPFGEAVVGGVAEVNAHSQVVVVGLEFVADLGVDGVLETGGQGHGERVLSAWVYV